MSTVVLVVITVIAISVLVIFAITTSQSGKTTASDQLSIGSSATDVANCNLWASGMSSGFDCSGVACPKEALCDACKNKVDTASCDWSAAGITVCSQC